MSFSRTVPLHVVAAAREGQHRPLPVGPCRHRVPAMATAPASMEKKSSVPLPGPPPTQCVERAGLDVGGPPGSSPLGTGAP